jgi:PAS domain S-box-containing protein
VRKRTRNYESPTITKALLGHLPPGRREHFRSLASGLELLETRDQEDECGILLDLEGKFKRASSEFCHLVGYDIPELLGRHIDDFTVSRSVNIPLQLGAVLHFGRFHSLWMFVHREGHAVLVRNDWALLADMSIEVFCRSIASGR